MCKETLPLALCPNAYVHDIFKISILLSGRSFLGISQLLI
jgi:hypothetical protein